MSALGEVLKDRGVDITGSDMNVSDTVLKLRENGITVFEGHDARNIDWTGRFAWLNLTRPEYSPALTVHLPKEQGGRGLSVEPGDSAPRYVFETKDDPAWQTMLHAIEKGRADALARPEADQSGFTNARPEP